MPEGFISRRDFLNGALLAAGGSVVARSVPMRILAAAATGESCDGPIGEDARALRSGNLRSTFKIAHWMRDRRLTFRPSAVELADGCDGESGTFNILEDTGKYDVIIVGGGIAGLSTAFYTLRRRRNARILILDANDEFGGNARRDDQPPMPVMASAASSYCIPPYAEFQEQIYGAIGLDWERYKIPGPVYSYFFDDRTPGAIGGRRGWNLDTYGKGLTDVPYSPEIVRQLVRCRDEFAAWNDRDGAPTDPADASAPRFDYLSRMSLHDYFVKELKCDPIVSDFYTQYTVDALAGTTSQVNAHSGICFLAAEYGDLFAFPGGNAGLARLLMKWLNPDAISGDAVTSMSVHVDTFDRPQNRVRVRQRAVALRADQGSIVYHSEGRFYRANAKAIVIASGSHSAQHLVAHLADNRRREMWKALYTVPVVVANVAVKSAAPFVDIGLGYNSYWWGSRYWSDFIVADWVTPNRATRDRPTVLTFFAKNTADPHELAAERFKLLNTPFEDYERSIREDLSRVMAGTAFDFERDVTAIYLYRWGHGMIMPTPGQVFGNGVDRKSSPRHIASAPMGRISFAGQETEGTPSIECAIASGDRAAKEVLRHL